MEADIQRSRRAKDEQIVWVSMVQFEGKKTIAEHDSEYDALQHVLTEFGAEGKTVSNMTFRGR